jgi:hypothetical protein
MISRCQVFYGEAEGLEKRDLVWRPAAIGLAKQDFADLTHNVALVDHAFLD